VEGWHEAALEILQCQQSFGAKLTEEGVKEMEIDACSHIPMYIYRHIFILFTTHITIP
jgi:hypothetical protein